MNVLYGQGKVLIKKINFHAQIGLKLSVKRMVVTIKYEELKYEYAPTRDLDELLKGISTIQ